MGRSVPTFRMEVESRIGAWQELLRALRGNDRDAFLAIIAAARRHEDAAGMMNPVDPLEGMLLSVLVEQEKRLRRLERDAEEKRWREDLAHPPA
ncbi:MAG TPA: hypothetical protein VI893_03040 [Thermoplasmata archaeon]|nr:hypothetical protein [Thermoplasmata archaeon]